MIVYLAHPIDLVDSPSEPLAQVRAVLSGHGAIIYDPAEAWTLGHALITEDEAQALLTANMAVLGRCDAVVAVLDQPSVGVPIEIYIAREHGIPVVVYGLDGSERSVMLKAMGVEHFHDTTRLRRWMLDWRRSPRIEKIGG